MKRLGLLSLAFCFLASTASAVLTVVPNINESTPGPSNQAFPFNQGDMRYQQVFAADQFHGLTGLVTSFAYRIDEEAGDPFGPSTINTQIWLSHTSKNPQGLSTTFDDNSGADKTLVFSGNMVLSSAGNGFDIIFDINDVFAYNGKDNLLLEVKVFGSANTTQFDAAGTGLGQGGTPWTSRLWAFGPNSATGSTAGDDGMVTAFDIQAVPEPASMAALALGVAAILRRRIRK